ncbi:hypothetical protein Hanom_Chr16g01444361 [Helianthus anomalus]
MMMKVATVVNNDGDFTPTMMLKTMMFLFGWWYCCRYRLGGVSIRFSRVSFQRCRWWSMAVWPPE